MDAIALIFSNGILEFKHTQMQPKSGLCGVKKSLQDEYTEFITSFSIEKLANKIYKTCKCYIVLIKSFIISLGLINAFHFLNKM